MDAMDWQEKAAWLDALGIGDKVGMWQGSLRPHLGKVTKITKTRRMTVVFDSGREHVFDHEGDLYPRAQRWSTAWVLVRPDAAFYERLRWFDAEAERQKLSRELEGWANANAPNSFDHVTCNAALRGVLQQLRRPTTPESGEDQRAREAHEAQYPGALVTGSTATGWLAMLRLPAEAEAPMLHPPSGSETGLDTGPETESEDVALPATEGGRTARRAAIFAHEILELLPGLGADALTMAINRVAGYSMVGYGNRHKANALRAYLLGKTPSEVMVASLNAQDRFEDACPEVPVELPGVYRLSEHNTLHLDVSGWRLVHDANGQESWESAVALVVNAALAKGDTALFRRLADFAHKLIESVSEGHALTTAVEHATGLSLAGRSSQDRATALRRYLLSDTSQEEESNTSVRS